jgi:hypothetical protein
MEKEQINEATLQLYKIVKDANHAVVESVVADKESNTKFAQRVYQDWMKEWLKALESYTENTRALMRELEQHNQDQQEALQKLVQGSRDIYFDFLRASLLSQPLTILLHESLQFCLLALESRCPRHIVNINEEVLGPQSLGAEGWTTPDLIELLQNTYPLLLLERALLEVDCRCKGIYLLESSEQIPAFWVYIGGIGEKMPEYRGNMAARQKNQLATSGA